MHGQAAIVPRETGLRDQVEAHLKAVREIYERVIHTQKPTENFPKPAFEDTAELEISELPGRSPSWRAQLRHLERKSPQLAAAVDRLPIRFGIRHFEHFLNHVISTPDLIRGFERTPRLLECVGDLIEHSPFLAEELIRHPGDIAKLKGLLSKQGDAGGPQVAGAEVGRGSDGGARSLTLHPEIERQLETDAPVAEMSTWLRQFYRGRMLTLQAESIHLRHPIFSTLAKTSLLAEWIIRAAYEIAVRAVARSSGQPLTKGELQVVALGRLGMREFDLASDADLVFVLLDSAEERRELWRQVVEQMVDIVSSYTSEGMMFTVDTRLRPMGRDGQLVQTESQYKRYFAERAEPWEGITYMKARTIAGDNLRGTRFLSDLQQVDWKRYGQSGDLAPLLVEMRKRLENEQGRERPIKSGAGGYYDIDFILMYLRLRDAGVFFPLLNTPERIRVIRTLGHLTVDEAARLEKMAVFYRSLDHAIRLVTGRSASTVPSSPSTRQILAELVDRWCMSCGVEGRVDKLLDRVRRETREMFWKVFGGVAPKPAAN
jgi:glutamate-ammonia-ligase adenylyltransferase